MSRKSPRFVPAGSLVEVTARTVGGRYLLVPSEDLNAAIRGIVGRALSLYPVELHAIAFMSNHWHALVSVADAQALSRFVQYVHSNIARVVKRLHDWDGSVFGKAAYIVVGASSEESRLRYVLAQGVKEGLVRRCVDWPGVHSARALLLEEVCVGRWEDRRRARALRAGGGRVGGREPLRGEVELVYPIDFAPLPSWRQLDLAARLRRVRAIIGDIEAAASAAFPSVLGIRGVMTREPSRKPTASKRGVAPPIHTVDPDERAAFSNRLADFSTSFDIARARLRSGGLAPLPAGCFAPVVPFVGSAAMLWSLRRSAGPPTRCFTQKRFTHARLSWQPLRHIEISEVERPTS